MLAMELLLALIVLQANYFSSLSLNLIPDLTKNACPLWTQYDTRPVQPKCFFNRDITGEITDIVARHGFPASVFTVTTKDKYILQQFRIGDPSGETILVIHGLYQNPKGWTLEGNDSLAYVLAAAGKDVWLVSLRGTLYSSHETLKETDRKYWEYTPHEMGTLDLPAIIEMINQNNKGRPIILLGYSMGSTASLIYTSVVPQHATNFQVIRQIHIAPVAYLDDITSSLRVADFVAWSQTSAQLKNSGTYQVLKPTPQSRQTASSIFLPTTINVLGYWTLLGSIFGYSCQYNPATIAATILNGGDAVSLYVLDFYVQIMKTSKFGALDYGDPQLNQDHYGSKIPPVYDLGNISIDTSLYYGLNDILATPKNAKRLFSELNPNVQTCLNSVPFAQFTHQDFVTAEDARELVYQPLVDVYLKGQCNRVPPSNCVDNFFEDLSKKYPVNITEILHSLGLK